MDEGNRRLAGILAADIVSYSRLLSADEPGTLRRVRTLRVEIIEPIAQSHGGRIFKTTGDGFLAAFASAVQAVRAAITIQQAVRERDDGLRLRIGVHQGEVVSEGEDFLGDGVIIASRLESLADPGGICISGRVREDAAGKMALEVEDLGTPALKNIAQPISVFRVRLDAQVAPPELAFLQPRLSIVVLPFELLGGDPADGYLADGITEDLTTDLSHVPGTFVIARGSAYSYRGKATDVRRIGAELGVRYAVEGSVRRLGATLRVNAQLISTETGAQLWSDRFDQPISDLASGQEQIVIRLRAALAIGLTDIEARRSARERPTNPDAFDLILRARAERNRPESPEPFPKRCVFSNSPCSMIRTRSRPSPGRQMRWPKAAWSTTQWIRWTGQRNTWSGRAGLSRTQSSPGCTRVPDAGPGALERTSGSRRAHHRGLSELGKRLQPSGVRANLPGPA